MLQVQNAGWIEQGYSCLLLLLLLPFLLLLLLLLQLFQLVLGTTALQCAHHCCSGELGHRTCQGQTHRPHCACSVSVSCSCCCLADLLLLLLVLLLYPAMQPDASSKPLGPWGQAVLRRDACSCLFCLAVQQNQQLWPCSLRQTICGLQQHLQQGQLELLQQPRMLLLLNQVQTLGLCWLLVLLLVLVLQLRGLLGTAAAWLNGCLVVLHLLC